ncbi:hypothetical protein ACU5AX_09220 [Sphingomonas sp. XXL09]|uniref:hypothetical protein n=1 Tax=Sphingomonas sp. XXL09 TaxID=3457787 RepID=UPI00406BA1B9
MHKYEDTLRNAHVAGLELLLGMRQAQAERGLTAITGHAMFRQFDEAQVQIGTAIASAAAGHRLARSVATSVGVDPHAYGEVTDPAAVETPLRRVG